MTLKTRKPSGVVPWPFLLIEGPEKSGKSWMAALLSASPKVSRMLWLEVGSEGTADQYGAIPDANYEIVEHNGTRQSIVAAIQEARTEAQAALDAGDPPVVFVVDTGSAVWDLYKAWADQRARSSKYGKKILENDPNADVPIDRGHWTYVTDSYYEQFIEPLKRFPGIAIVIARGKEVSSTDDNGRPIPNSREYKVEGQKNLGFDVHAWIRLSRSGPATVIGMRSVKHPLRPGSDAPIQDKNLTLEKFIFEVLGCDPATAETVKTPVRTELEQAKADLWKLAQDMRWDMAKLAAGFKEENPGRELTEATKEELDAYADFLRLCLAQPAEEAAKAGTS